MPDLTDLSVPGQHDYTDPTVEQDPRRLGKWLDDLPLMNVGETVRLALGSLTAMNEQKLDAIDRFRCMEIYRSTASRLFDTVDPIHIRQLSMSRSQRHATIESVARLFTGMADGYKLVVTGMYSSNQRADKKQVFAHALNRTVESLAMVLLDCYRYYRNVSPGMFRELYILYRMARRDGLLDTRVQSGGDAQHASTAELFHSIILLSLVEPERLAEGESGLLYDVISQHADRCRILQGNSWDSSDALFLLDLASDSLPVSCSRLAAPASAGEPFLLDIAGLLNILREKIAGIPEMVRLQSPEAIVMRRLTPGESGESLRREQRHSDDRHVGLLCGLAQIHAWLSAGGQQGSHNPAECRVLDSSENGMKLSCKQHGAGDISVGELVGILDSAEGDVVMRLATIRSIQVLDDNGVQAGMQLLAEGMGAVTCRDPDDPDAVPMQALFLPADEAADIAATLVVADGIYQESCRLIIDVGGREIHVSSGRLVSDSPLYNRFEFFAD